ncbi:MAG: hypothetical protein WCU88_07985 [Elusimicrobiota bacterium]|jgi:transcriptional regulator with XRE-family HTH domain
MGILHNREELIPVTCAVLSDEDRRDFFAKIRKKAGKTERIAQLCGTTPSVVADWMSGKCLVPFHSLQRMAQEFGVEAPQVTELRREYQAIANTLPRAPHYQPEAPPPPAPRPAQRKSEPRPEKKARPERPPRKKPAQQKQQHPPQPKKEPRKKAPQPSQAKRAPAAHSKVPSGRTKYSDRLAYWTGALLAAGHREETGLKLKADRIIGQNFASTWARTTKTLFAVEPALSMSEDHRAQEAFLPNESFKDFEQRVELKIGQPAPAAPRWTWSNPDWKAAFLRGTTDACAHFHRTPALNLLGLSEPLRRSVQKILSSLGMESRIKEDGTVVIEGAAIIEKYFSSVSTENLKLRDQFTAWQKSSSKQEHGRHPQAHQEPAQQEASQDLPPPFTALPAEDPETAVSPAEPQPSAQPLPDAESSVDDTY